MKFQLIIYFTFHYSFAVFFVLLKYGQSEAISSYAKAFIYDSTTVSLQNYPRSQGLLGFEKKNALQYIQNYSNELEEQGLTLVRDMILLRVVYARILSQDLEYIFGLTKNSTIEGYSIPVINNSNNRDISPFFEERAQFLIRITSDTTFVSSNIIGFEPIFDPSTNNFTLFICSSSQGIIYTVTAISSNTKVNFSIFSQAVTKGATTCTSIFKINDAYVLINNEIICSYSTVSCIKISQTVSNPQGSVLVSGVYHTPQFQFKLSTNQITSYSWLLSTETIINIFNYQQAGVYLLFVLKKTTGVSIAIRSATDYTLLFEDLLNQVTDLSQSVVYYGPSQELYVVSTASSSSASVLLFCMNSSFNTTTFTCTNNLMDQCLWETEKRCVSCIGFYYANNDGICTLCNSKCAVGCTSAKDCIDCYGNFRRKSDTCACIPPRIEPSRLRVLTGNSNDLQLRQLASLDCVCPPELIPKSDGQCLNCQSAFQRECDTCNTTQCLTCISKYFLQLLKCQPCSSINPNCANCTTENGCILCFDGYYLQDSQTCVYCQTIIPNCDTCSNSLTCINCLDNYYLENKSCVLCPTVCKNGCSSKITCQNCFQPRRISSQACICGGGTIEVGVNCDCPSGQFWQDEAYSCKTCFSLYTSQCSSCSQSTCLVCDEGYYVSSKLSGACAACSPLYSNCISCVESKCTTCKSLAYFIDAVSGQCSLCNANCILGCITYSNCKNCIGNFKDELNACACLENRIENSATSNCECPIGTYENVPITDNCSICTEKFGTACLSCTINECTKCAYRSYYSPDLVKCTLCASDFGDACSECQDSGCTTCNGGTLVNSEGICTCSSSQFYENSICNDCSFVFTPSCKSCDSQTCFDCGDINSYYDPANKSCLCNFGHYLGTIINSQIVCQSCADTFTSFCKSCTSLSCVDCSNGYQINQKIGDCECPPSSIVINEQCKTCKEIFGDHCTACNQSSCLVCDQIERIPSSSCKCRDSNAIELNDSCFECNLSSSYSSSLSLTSVFSFLIDCNFSSEFIYSGDYELILQKEFQQSSTNSVQLLIPLASKSSVTDIILPHGNSIILGTFKSSNYQILQFELSLTLEVSNIYSSFSSLYENYFSLNALQQQTFSTTESLTYIAEFLEIKQSMDDYQKQHPANCDSTSLNGEFCACQDKDSYFFDCSGNLSDYNNYQQLMMKYYQFLTSRETNLDNLTKNQFQLILPIVSSVIDYDHLANDSTQIDNVIQLISYQISLIDGSSFIPTNFQDLANQIVSSLSLILTSSIATPIQLEKALSLISNVQQSAFLTFDPTYTQPEAKPQVCEQIKSSEIQIYQHYFQCPTSSLNITSIVFQVELSQGRFLNENQMPDVRILSIDCNKILFSSSQVGGSYYYGVSISIFKKNPYSKIYPLPYEQQVFQFFSSEVKDMTGSHSRMLVPSSSSSRFANQIFPLSFSVVKYNPVNISMPLNNTFFRCIYLNFTNPNQAEWSKCPSHTFSDQNYQLLCNCQSQATYLYDGTDLFNDNAASEKEKQKQITLIIVAIVLAVIFVILLILFAIFYKPKLENYQLADQIGKTDENIATGINQKLHHNLSQVKQSESQHFASNSKHDIFSEMKSPAFKHGSFHKLSLHGQQQQQQLQQQQQQQKHQIYNKSSFSPQGRANQKNPYLNNMKNDTIKEENQTFNTVSNLQISKNNKNIAINDNTVHLDAPTHQNSQTFNFKLETFGGGNNSSFQNDKSQQMKVNKLMGNNQAPNLDISASSSFTSTHHDISQSDHIQNPTATNVHLNPNSRQDSNLSHLIEEPSSQKEVKKDNRSQNNSYDNSFEKLTNQNSNKQNKDNSKNDAFLPQFATKEFNSLENNKTINNKKKQNSSNQRIHSEAVQIPSSNTKDQNQKDKVFFSEENHLKNQEVDPDIIQFD